MALVDGDARAQTGETLEADISARQIAVESTFAGVHIIIFGAVDNSRQRTPTAGLYDIAVVIRGPKQTLVTRRKEQVAGIWLNAESETFENVPGYYAVLSTRPLSEMAKPELLKKYRLGFDNLSFLPEDHPGDHSVEEAPFRDAVIRIKQREKLYVADERGVSFLGPSLFRADVLLPANVPVGDYTADIYLFSKGRLLSQNSSQFFLNKEGFELLITLLAFKYPLAYGILAVLVAIAAGLIASAAFRRD